MSAFKQFTFKKFGYVELEVDSFNAQAYEGFIKVVWLCAGARIVVDFKEYLLQQDALFFINAHQYYHFEQPCQGTMLYYNRDFYCVEIHDKEVACDGILFHNVYEIPVVYIPSEASAAMQGIVGQIKEELKQDDSGMEEMLRILLKQLIIKATRLWKAEHHVTNEQARQEVEFSRTFSQLVEWNYMKHHTVADYADMLHITPKGLNKRIARYSQTSPNELIKNRIILEAKRLLAHTSLSVKEIGYKLGYEDTSYFIRLFTKQAQASPQSFRLHYQQTSVPAVIG